MGYIIINEEKLEQRLRLWNSDDYYRKAMSYISAAKDEPSKILEALVQAEEDINERIHKLQRQKEDIGMLMNMGTWRKGVDMNNFSDALMYYKGEYRRFVRDMKEWQSTPPQVYGEYLQRKRRKKKRRNRK